MNLGELNIYSLPAKILSGLLFLFVPMSCTSPPQPTVHVVGAMKNVMLKGELFGTIALDTISAREHLYGLGPVENLVGEILIADGVSYIATIADDSTIRVEKRFDVRAPFFVYARIDQWNKQDLPESVHTLRQLENFLDRTTQKTKRPFA
ncbi:MAG TPA: acetolactate decarboxylase, partial [Bacteroidota bacterium]|nr:acetolactate decarboxylase [Bacteroidota bacterium]